MKKAFVVRLLCMALVALLPLMALAETAAPVQATYTITVTPGEELRETPAVGDLFDVLAIQVFGLGENAAGLSLLVSDEPVLTLALRADEDNLFIESKELYEKPIYIGLEQLQTLLESNMEQSGMNNAMVGQYMQMFKGGAFYEYSVEKAEGLSGADLFKLYEDPEYREKYIEAMGGDESLLIWMESIYDDMVLTEGEFTGEDHDPANLKMEIVITEADMISMFDTSYMRNQLKSQLAVQNPSLSEEELEKKLDETIAEAKKEIEGMDLQMPMTALYEDNMPVSISMTMTAKSKEGTDPSQAVDMGMTMDYSRLTTDGTARHAFDMNADSAHEDIAFTATGTVNHFADGSFDLDLTLADKEETIFSAMGTYQVKDDGATALLSLLPQGDDEVLITFDRTAAETGSENHLTLYSRAPGADRLSLSESDKPLITFNVTSEHGTPDGQLGSILAATKEGSLDVLNLSAQDMNSLMSDVYSNLMRFQSSVISKLPNSVLMLLLGGTTTTTPAP